MWEIKYSLVGVCELTTLASLCCFPKLHVHPLNAPIKIRFFLIIILNLLHTFNFVLKFFFFYFHVSHLPLVCL